MKIFNDFSWENHGHGGHEHGVHRGVFRGEISFKKLSAGGRLCTLQVNPHFWVATIKVRPPDGISDYSNGITLLLTPLKKLKVNWTAEK
jgi:hypothetical protein